MNKNNTSYLRQHEDILSFRDLAIGTVNTYVSYLSQFIDWTESFLGAKPLPDISWEEIRSYIRYLKDVRSLNPRTINVHIAQLRDFYQYVLHRDWDRYQVPYLHYDQLLPRVPDKKQEIPSVRCLFIMFSKSSWLLSVSLPLIILSTRSVIM